VEFVFCCCSFPTSWPVGPFSDSRFVISMHSVGKGWFAKMAVGVYSLVGVTHSNAQNGNQRFWLQLHCLIRTRFSTALLYPSPLSCIVWWYVSARYPMQIHVFSCDYEHAIVQSCRRSKIVQASDVSNTDSTHTCPRITCKVNIHVGTCIHETQLFPPPRLAPCCPLRPLVESKPNRTDWLTRMVLPTSPASV
jgi:hypothetical protein